MTYHRAEIVVAEICPFCDEPFGPRHPSLFHDLPLTTSETLPNLIAELWPLSLHSPRPTNINGRRVYNKDSDKKHNLCLQHEYEAGILPLALQFSWPKDTDEERLLNRLKEEGCWFRLRGVFLPKS